MRRTSIWLVAACGLVIAGCGGNSTFANKPRPPTPVDLTVYINDARVSLSPNAVGAGPVSFLVTNQATTAQSLTILPAGVVAGQPLADTGPINPQATAEVTVNFNQPGDSTVATGVSSSNSSSNSSSDANLGAPTSSIQPATLHIGPLRPSATNQLLEP